MAAEEGKSVQSIVAVEPKPRNGFLSAAVDLLERAVVYVTGHSGKPNYYLSGNFGPVQEETPPCRELKIRGTLPVSPATSQTNDKSRRKKEAERKYFLSIFVTILSRVFFLPVSGPGMLEWGIRQSRAQPQAASGG